MRTILCMMILTATIGVAAEPVLTPDEARLLKSVESLTPTDAVARLRTVKAPSPAILFAIGSALARAGEQRAAAEAFLAAATAMPGFGRARLNAAKLFMRLDEYKQAAAQLLRLADGMGTDMDAGAGAGAAPGEVWLLLAQCHLRNGDLLAAEAAAACAVALRPADCNAALLWMQALAALPDGLPRAAVIARQLLAQSPTDTTCWRLCAAAEITQEHYQRAMDILETAGRFGADDPQMRLSLLELMLQRNITGPAVKLALSLLADNNMTPELFVLSLRTCRENRDTTSATKLLDALTPDFAKRLPPGTIEAPSPQSVPQP